MRGKVIARGNVLRPAKPGEPIKHPDKQWKPPSDGPIIPEKWKPPQDPEIPTPPPGKEPPENPSKD